MVTENKKIRGNVEQFEQAFLKIGYWFTKDKMFIPIGLELTNTNVYFEHDEEFTLNNVTFAYYNPIDNSIRINIDDPFFTSCTDRMEREARLIFILFHEVNHKLLMHTPQRLGTRNPSLWNIAADYEVHNMLYTYISANGNDNTVENVIKPYLSVIKNMMEKIDGKNFNKKSHSNKEEDPANPTFLFDSNLIEKIAEEIYAIIEQSKEEKSESFNLKLSDFMGNSSHSSQNNSNNQNDEDNEKDDENDNGDGDDGDDNGNNEKDIEDEGKEGKKNGKPSVADKLNKHMQKKMNSKSSSNNKTEIDENITVTVDTVTYTLPNGQKYTTHNINWPKNEQLPDGMKKFDKDIQKDEQRKALNRSLMENNFAEMAKNKGNISTECQKFLKKLFHIKIDWEKILRNSLQTILEKTDYFAWNTVRTSTFLLPNMPYLPDIMEDNEKYGTLIVARDESGSMSDEAIAKAGQIIMDAKAHYKKVVVLKHDVKIVKETVFEDINDDVIKDLITRNSDGGTSHLRVFEYLRDYKKNHPMEDISCFIGITDLCSDIQQYQDIVPSKIPMIWLAPISSEDYFKDIKGKIIPVEL